MPTSKYKNKPIFLPKNYARMNFLNHQHDYGRKAEGKQTDLIPQTLVIATI